MSPDFQLALSSLSNKTSAFIKPINSSYIAGYSLIKDIKGSPIALFRIELFREAYLKGVESTVILGSSLL